MKSIKIRNQYIDVDFRYVGKKRLARHKRKNLLLKLPDLMTIKSVVYKNDEDNTGDRYFYLMEQDNKEVIEILNKVKEFNGELIFGPLVNKTKSKSFWDELSKIRNNYRFTYFEDLREALFNNHYRTDCFVIFKNSSDYNQFKLAS